MIDGCHSDGKDASATRQGTSIKSTTGALVFLTSCLIENAVVGLQCGAPGDTISTVLRANSITLFNCTTDVQQNGSSLLRFLGGVFDQSAISIADPTNVNFGAFDRTNNDDLAFGSNSDLLQQIYEILNGQPTLPLLVYNPNYYGHKGTAYINANANPTFNATQSNVNNANYYVITGDRTKTSAINLISDTNSTVGSGANVRGWEISKVATTADLAFTYTNNDTSGQAARGFNTVMQLDGFNNLVKFPLAINSPLPTNTVAQLVWAGDTNLYRSATNTLKTDSNFSVGTLNSVGVVHNDATGLLSTSLIVNADISPTAGIVDTKLATIITAGKVANSATTATSANTPSTIVLRDSSGDFSANTVTASLTGTASGNVLKTGDTMSGNLNMAAQSELRFQDATGGEYVGLNAPTTVPTSYTVNLPAVAPTAGQLLQATSPTATTWTTSGGGVPAVSKTYYVSKGGSDSNDGSFNAPFLTVSHAVTVANTVASTLNPVVIKIGAGLFVENNSGGPITISANGITIFGSSNTGTIIVPTTLSNNLFACTTSNVLFSTLALDSGSNGGSTASGVSVVAPAGQGGFQSVIISRFQTGLSLSGSITVPQIVLANVVVQGNSTGIAITDARIIIENCVFLGALSGSTPANTAITITGTNALVTLLANSLRLLGTGISATGGSNVRMLGTNIETTTNSLVASGASNVAVVGCNFIFNNASSINVNASGANTAVTLDGCQFQCHDASNVPQGVAIQLTNAASVLADSCAIESPVIGIVCGTTGDTSTTSLKASGVTIVNGVADIVQEGSSMLQFVAGTFDETKITIADPTNVSFAAFNNDAELVIGNSVDSQHTIFNVLNGQTTLPSLTYEPNYYGSKGLAYINANANPTFNATQGNLNNANYYVITGDRTKTSSINLISDTNSTVGSGANVRGWGISKVATTADLAFTYTNNDTSGQAARGLNTVMQLDGFNNLVNFPLATNSPLPTNTVAQLVWAGDTNLYRSTTNTLKTDSNFSVGALSTAGVVHNDATGLLSTSLIVNADVSPTAGIVDTKLATIITAGKVANSATTATSTGTPSTIVLRDGSSNFATNMITLNGTTTNATDAATKSYVDTAVSTGFTVHPAAVVYSATNITLSGTQTIDDVALVANDRVLLNGQTDPIENGLWLVQVGAWTRPTDFSNGTTAGSAYVLITSGTVFAGTSWVCATPTAIIGTDSISFAQFSEQSSITGANVGVGAGQIFRDKIGNTLNFKTIAAGTHITVTNNTNDVTIGTDATSANTASTIVARDGSGNFAAGTITAALAGNATTATTATNFSGSLVGNVTGTQGATVVATVGGQSAANVASGVVAANAATDTNTASTIVKRDASGNFAAGTITASLTGNVTGNLTGNATTATTATTATNFTGSLVGDVTGTQGATVVSTVGGQTASAVAAATVLANAATSANTASTIVRRDASGNFSATTITAALSGNATTATTATNFSGSLVGDVTGTQGATVVSTVGGQSAANVASGAVLANAATNLNTANQIVKRDGSGNFVAGTITAALNGNATTATSATTATTATTATNFSGSLVGDVTGTQGATVVSTVGGQTAANVAAGTVLANNATNTNTVNQIVRRDASGDFAAGTITATSFVGPLTGNVTGNATTATTATTATNFSGSLVGDVTGTQGATVVSTVGGQTSSAVAAATVLANAATSANTASAIVRRDASGDFSAGTVSATTFVGALTGAASLNVLKAGDTMTGTLTHPAGTAAAPSIQFTGSTNTGFSALTANTISFDSNGVEQMTISPSVITVKDSCVFTDLISNQAVQTANPASSTGVTAAATTSILLLTITAARTNVTITFPPNPTNGQYFTIVDGSVFSITLINAAGTGGAAIVNPVTTLAPATNPTASANGAAVTYYYNSTNNAWYRIGRG
jgi:hypothetical protein